VLCKHEVVGSIPSGSTRGDALLFGSRDSWSPQGGPRMFEIVKRTTSGEAGIHISCRTSDGVTAPLSRV
jgi:hypothetical protein